MNMFIFVGCGVPFRHCNRVNNCALLTSLQSNHGCVENDKASFHLICVLFVFPFFFFLTPLEEEYVLPGCVTCPRTWQMTTSGVFLRPCCCCCSSQLLTHINKVLFCCRDKDEDEHREGNEGWSIYQGILYTLPIYKVLHGLFWGVHRYENMADQSKRLAVTILLMRISLKHEKTQFFTH